VILAIDQGTTGSTCLVFGEDGTIAGRAYSEFAQHFPRPGWVEHDASEIWEVTRRVGREALADAGIEGADLTGIGITNQRETVVGWDRDSGEPIHHALVWQDRRTSDRCRELKEQGHEQLVRERTGLVIDPYFSGTKIEWLLANAEGADRAVFGTIDSWLVHKLCGEHVTDLSNASRTMLLDIRSGEWDQELCDLLGVDPATLPRPCGSCEVYGTTSEFGGEVPVAGIAGDQQAALFGQACHEPGDAKNTYGTGSFVLLNSGTEPPDPGDGLLATIAWGMGGEITYALEASVFVTGAAVQWLRDGLGLIETARETEELAASLDGNDGVYFVPALTGLGSPYWDPYARGALLGLTRGTGRAQIVRATLEAIAYQTVDAVRAQEAASGEALTALRADGGATVNDWLMQFQADALGVPVIVPEIAETTALGAAYLAGIATGLWDLAGVKAMWRERASFEPRISAEERESLLDGWHRAVERSRNWASEGPGQ
jgi:glycerol kinase